MSISRSPKKHAMIIGVDFGTTYSGVAWTFTGDPCKMKIIKSWPGENGSLEQVPSVLSYNTKDSRKYRWGFEVNPDTPNPISWFKLLLNENYPENIGNSKPEMRLNPTTAVINDHNSEITELDHLQTMVKTIPKGKKPVDLVADYLRALYMQAHVAIRQAYPESFAEQIGKDTPIRYCLTVPAVWSDKAKDLTLQAAKEAGMKSENSSIRLISEPEAAAVHCLRTYQDTQDCLKVGDVYVIADCGGGTVDLISYEVTAIEPRLQVKECVAGTGGLCGSTSLNRRFISFLKERLGSDLFKKTSPRALHGAIQHFDRYSKPMFFPSDPKDDDFDDEDNTIYCPLQGVADDTTRSIHGGYLLITPDEMKKIFQPTFEEIVSLVQSQVAAAEKASEKAISGVLLVGGFGESKYLRHYLEQNIKSVNDKPIPILQPVDAWTAIVRGAVLDGVSLHLSEEACDENNNQSRSMVQSRIARYSYGVEVRRPFIKGVHPPSKMHFDIHHGLFYCHGRMSWYIRKGEHIPDNNPIVMPLFRTTECSSSNLTNTMTVYCCDTEDPPDDVDDYRVLKLLDYTNDWRGLQQHFQPKQSVVGGGNYWHISLNQVMRYDSAELLFSTETEGKQVGKSPLVQYNHETPPASSKWK